MCWIPVRKVMKIVSGSAVLLSVPRSEYCISFPQQSNLDHPRFPVWENADVFGVSYVFSS